MVHAHGSVSSTEERCNANIDFAGLCKSSRVHDLGVLNERCTLLSHRSPASAMCTKYGTVHISTILFHQPFLFFSTTCRIPLTSM